MKSVVSFINYVGQNHYLSLLVKSDEETIDFDKYDLKVLYNNNYYYELTIEEIHFKRREIIANIRDLYIKAISEVYVNLSTKDSEQIEPFIHFNIESVKFKLKILRNDFYIDNNLSRYHSTIDVYNPTLSILSLYMFKYSRESDFEINDEVLNTISKDVDSNYSKDLLDFFYQRFEAISFIPMYLFIIASQFINELEKIKNMMSQIKDERSYTKIKWTGKQTHIGFIIGTLIDQGYIDAPKKNNGEINYTKLAIQIKQNFDVDVTDETLRKYLNPMDDKHQQSKTMFDKQNFHLPHSNSI